jgi:hyperosmotically inducible periplasmic protein
MKWAAFARFDETIFIAPMIPRGGELDTPRRYYDDVTPSRSMKKSVIALLAVLATSSGFVLFQTGCAATPTRESTGEYVDDSSITTKVKAALVRDPVVKALDVKVETFKGVVQLSGFVDTPDQKSRAEQVTRGIAGVQSVKNNISIK